MMHDEVVSRLRHVLTEGEIAPGARIPERELCASFAISRTPLREALKVLAAEGLVVLLPNRGSRAAKLTQKDVKELFEVCEALEAAAGELACPRISDEQLREIADLQANMVEHYRARDLLSDRLVVLHLGDAAVLPVRHPAAAVAHEQHAQLAAADPLRAEHGRQLHGRMLLPGARRGHRMGRAGMPMRCSRRPASSGSSSSPVTIANAPHG